MKIDCHIPDDWKVQLHFFIGHILVDRPQEEPEVGFHQKKTQQHDAFLPFAQDLRMVEGIKRRTPDDDVCSLYGIGGGLLAVVNAPFEPLIAKWMEIRNEVDITRMT